MSGGMGAKPLIGTEWTEPKRASQKGTWDVVARDGVGGEFCRRSYRSRADALKAEAALRTLLATCLGDILSALSAWAGYKVQVPLWWA